MSVERWAVHFTHNPKTGRNDYEGMVRHPVGAYVAYADYKALTAELEALRRDAARYEAMRAWFLRDGKRMEIAPLGHIKVTSAADVDAWADAARHQEATNG